MSAPAPNVVDWDEDYVVQIPVFHSAHCLLHDPPTEILAGELVPYFESPARYHAILKALFPQRNATGKQPFVERELDFSAYDKGPLAFRRALEAVHSQDYREFFTVAHAAWEEETGQRGGVMLPDCFVHRDLVLNETAGKELFESTLVMLGRFSFDLSAPIAKNTFQAARASARVAYEAAAHLINTDCKAAFALTRPPGHHAGRALMGGYCYFNNAAIAATYLQGATSNGKISILDIDYHAGNGTSKIFYSSSTVQYVSVHGYPEYPYYVGHPSEEGDGEGKGANINWPVSLGATTPKYLEAVKDAIADVRKFDPLCLVVSLGVDTYKDDPLTDFQVGLDAYKKVGGIIGGLDKPALFVMEGGYCIEKIGQCVRDVLRGFAEQFE